MEKVRIFCRGGTNSFEKLEKEVNTWLAENPDLKVVERHASIATGINEQGNSYVTCGIIIFYRGR